MLYSISIQGHPKRKQFVEELQRTLSRPEQSYIPVTWSHNVGKHGKKDCWPTNARARATYNPQTKYHLVLQDDALPCPNFHQHLTQMIYEVEKQTPIHPWMACLFYFDRPEFFLARRISMKARVGYPNGGFWWKGVHWAQSILMPTRCIPEFLAIGNALRLDEGDPDDDDRHYTAYGQCKSYKTWYPLPSLTDHNPACDSLVFNRMDGIHEKRDRPGGGCPNRLRQAWKLLGVRP
jgi:hypothetical protein